MIRPGLLTASTSRDDHFGMSAVCVCVWDWFCIFFAPFCCRSFWSLRRCFPLVVKLATTGRLTAHSTAETEWRTWSAAESCAGGLSWTMRTKRGKLIQSFLGWNRAQRNEGEALYECSNQCRLIGCVQTCDVMKALSSCNATTGISE